MSGKDRMIAPRIAAVLVSILFAGATAVSGFIAYQLHTRGNFHGVPMGELKNAQSLLGSLVGATVSLWAAVRIRRNRAAASLCGLISVGVLVLGTLAAFACLGAIGEKIDWVSRFLGFIFVVIPLLTLGTFAVLSFWRRLRTSTWVQPPTIS